MRNEERLSDSELMKLARGVKEWNCIGQTNKYNPLSGKVYCGDCDRFRLEVSYVQGHGGDWSIDHHGSESYYYLSVKLNGKELNIGDSTERGITRNIYDLVEEYVKKVKKARQKEKYREEEIREKQKLKSEKRLNTLARRKLKKIN